MDQFNLGMIGGGTVGSGVFHALQQNAELIAARTGIRIVVRKVAVKAFDEPRPYPIAERLMTLNWRDVVDNPEVHIVTELVGGTGIAKTMILAALERGKAVVTANKALISAHGPELFATARKNNTSLYFEASVAGGIPIIKVLRESLVGNRIERIDGIVNGTCNYILTRMKREGAAFADVLADAQRLGYAEADPTLDVDGHDAAHKIGILASLAHGFWVDHHAIHVEGIRPLTPLDIRFAAQLGYTIKLLGMVRIAPAAVRARSAKVSGPRISVSVSPTLVPDGHVLASVNDVFNAVFVSGFPIGDTLYYGRGAGKDATASAVLSDIADAALDRLHGTPQRVPAFAGHARDGRVVPQAETKSRFYLRLNVVDRAGVIARISGLISKAGISLASIVQPEQPEGHEGETVPLVLMTHTTTRADMNKAAAAIARLPAVQGPSLLLPVEDFA